MPVGRRSADQMLGPPAGLADREGGEDLGHPMDDGPHPDQGHQGDQRPLPGADRPHPQDQLGDSQQQLGPPVGQLGGRPGRRPGA